MVVHSWRCSRLSQSVPIPRLHANFGAHVNFCLLLRGRYPTHGTARSISTHRGHIRSCAAPPRQNAGDGFCAPPGRALMRRGNTLRPIRRRAKKQREINDVTDPHAILTWPDAVSMVRAALKGDGAQFPSNCSGVSVFTSWRKARTTAAANTEVAINRPMRLRFPQGSEVLISGCPNFGAAARSGLTNTEPEAETMRPEHRRWRVVFGFPPS